MADRIRELREARGLTQYGLAERAGLSRQLVGAIEARRHSPSVGAALAVARALGTTVEELFAEPAPAVTPTDDALEDRTPVRLGRVGALVVAHPTGPLAGTDERWTLPDGVWDAGAVDPFADAATATLVVAGCDPLLGPLADATRRGGGHRAMTVHASTHRAVSMIERGRVHAAVVHGPPGSLDPGILPVRRWRVARWQAGLAGTGTRPASLDQLVERRSPVVQREAGASSQAALDRALAEVGADGPLSGPIGTGHLDVARRVRSRECRAGVTMEAAAVALGLSFTPLEEHEVELWVDQRWIGEPAVGALIGSLTSAGFAHRAATIPGYDVTDMGSSVG